MKRKKIKKLKRKIAIGTLCIYIVFFCLIHFPIKGQVTFIDVGQGDSILITTPFPRKVYMIDTGGKLNFTGKKNNSASQQDYVAVSKSTGD